MLTQSSPSLFFQLKEDTEIKQLATANNSNVNLSPRTIYHIELDSSNLANQTCDLWCQQSLHLSWLWPESCQASMVCTRLTNHPCGDYKVKTLIGGDESELCTTGYQLHGTLEHNQRASINVEYVSDAAFAMSCYFWCTPDGDLPTDQAKDVIDEDLIQALTNGSEVIKTVNSLHTVMAHSHIYHGSNSDILQCSQSVCQFSMTFQWLGTGLCTAKTLCTTLEHKPCEDFGISLIFPDFRVSISLSMESMSVTSASCCRHQSVKAMCCTKESWERVRISLHPCGTSTTPTSPLTATSGALKMVTCPPGITTISQAMTMSRSW